MNLTNCPECKVRISSQARICPYCGVSLRQSAAGYDAPLMIDGPTGRHHRLRRGFGCFISCITFILLVLLLAFIGNLKSCRIFSPFYQLQTTTEQAFQ